MENNAQGKAIYPSWYTKQVKEASTRVIWTSIGGALLGIVAGVLALINRVWWMGVIYLIFAGCMLATGFMGAKKKNTTLLGIFSLICAVATIFGIIAWIIWLVVLIQVAAMSEDRFEYEYFDGSQEQFIIVGIVALVFYTLEIIFWTAAICFTVKLRDLLLHPPQQQAVPIVYQPPQGGQQQVVPTGQQFVQTQPINQNPAAFDVENQYPAVPPPQY